MNQGMSMMIMLTFDLTVRMLRNPDKFDATVREQTAQLLEKFGASLKDYLTGELMKDAVKDVPQGN